MKTITFTYTKKDGAVSSRTLLALVTPGGDKYAGIDVSELDADDAENFMLEAKKLHDMYIAELTKLQGLYDLKHNYRQFLVSGMSDITEI